MQNNINFGGNQRWVAVSDSYNLRMAENTRLPLFVRLVFLTEARMNRIGHAEFATGELESLLPTLDRRTGEIRNPSQNTVCKAIRIAIDEGFLSAESSARCLVLGGHDVQRSAKATSSCKHHGVQRAWGGGVEPTVTEKAEGPQEVTEVPEHQEEILEPETAVQVPSQPSWGDTQKTAEPTEEEDYMKILDEDIEFESEPAKPETVPDIEGWFEREGISEVSKNVAAYGITFRKGDSYEYILAVAEEADKEEYSLWGNNFNMRYTYAAQNVESIPERDRRPPVKIEEW
ncbi:hypothetical protein GTY86_02055 [Streptomyces sp. SID5770]|uniref:hypothetical protein n=1 Tax=Streptomyces sp. SID5770 TaxID=2690308 RepID=UPI00137087EF|nr:hypothetical protein [Streptomyces sp. SID5770]MZE50119.1 hypothetical protein [Streptomyces sp. SID5770]